MKGNRDYLAKTQLRVWMELKLHLDLSTSQAYIPSTTFFYSCHLPKAKGSHWSSMIKKSEGYVESIVRIKENSSDWEILAYEQYQRRTGEEDTCQEESLNPNKMTRIHIWAVTMQVKKNVRDITKEIWRAKWQDPRPETGSFYSPSTHRQRRYLP